MATTKILASMSQENTTMANTPLHAKSQDAPGIGVPKELPVRESTRKRCGAELAWSSAKDDPLFAMVGVDDYEPAPVDLVVYP